MKRIYTVETIEGPLEGVREAVRVKVNGYWFFLGGKKGLLQQGAAVLTADNLYNKEDVEWGGWAHYLDATIQNATTHPQLVVIARRMWNHEPGTVLDAVPTMEEAIRELYHEPPPRWSKVEEP